MTATPPCPPTPGPPPSMAELLRRCDQLRAEVGAHQRMLMKLAQQGRTSGVES